MSKTKGGSPKKAPAVVVPEPEPESPPEPQDLRHIRVTVEGYKNIAPLFIVSELEIKATYLDRELGISEKTSVIDCDFISVDQETHAFVIECDLNSETDLDELISNPVLLTVTEIPGAITQEALEKLQAEAKPKSEVINMMSADSEADLADAFLPIPIDRTTFISTPTSASIGKSGSRASTKLKNTSKSSVKRRGSGRKSELESEEEQVSIPPLPTLIGTAVLDLVPLFLGENEISECLPIIYPEQFYDERIIPNRIMPKMMVAVTVDEIEFFPKDENSNLINITVESMYNVPEAMTLNMTYSVATFLPSPFAKWKPLELKGGTFTESTEFEKMKKWPGFLDSGAITTKYRFNRDEPIINKTEENLLVVTENRPRVEWNMLKRMYLNGEATKELLDKLKKYRHLPLELHLAKSSAGGPPVKSHQDKSGKNKPAEKPPEIITHFMTTIDLSNLLYPGVTKCRIVCPFNTFHAKEILELTGLENSYFAPAPLSPESVKTISPGKGSKKPTSKESKKRGVGGNTGNLNSTLPGPPPPSPLPSQPVYNEEELRMFIIIEFEMHAPLHPKRLVEDLAKEISHLLPQKPLMPKVAVSSSFSNLYYKDVIKQLTNDLILQYEQFLDENDMCKCKKSESHLEYEFIAFLQSNGMYQTYLMSITKAASVIVNDKFFYPEESIHRSLQFQNHVTEVYCSLVKEMNKIIRDLASSPEDKIPSSPLMKLDPLLFYAREACEIGAILLADRYHLERLSAKTKNANAWFDYAVFQLEIGNEERALECVKECLEIYPKHHYSLLLCGILLAKMKSYEKAETCFLSAVFHNQFSVEAWGIFYLFYSAMGNEEGADLCLEMANKYLDRPSKSFDYFKSIDDLAWTTELCPNLALCKTAMILIKMRALSFAEKALAYEISPEKKCKRDKNLGVGSYYLAVISYYKQNYLNALNYVKKMEEIHGFDYAVGSLMGHCYLQMGNVEKARVQYKRVMELFSKPEDMHLLYMYLALVSEKLNDKQFSRRILLQTCKSSPTPYTWLSAGLLFYCQRDLLSAEQCFTQANICDNQMPEIWAYLTLINLELQRSCEAELCYRQVKKYHLKNKDLSNKIDKMLKSF